jgi:hypothetical protein
MENLYIADLQRIFKHNPEGLAVVIRYFMMPKKEALEKLQLDKTQILERLGPKGEIAASALQDIYNGMTKTTDESYSFISAWANNVHRKAITRRH